MKKYFNKIAAVLTPVALLTTVSCMDLDETIYSELSKDNFYNNKVEIMQGVLRPFTHMQAWLAPTGQNGFYFHGESSADQIAWPQKGRHGYDGGDHVRLHRHEWTDQEPRLRNAWSLMWEGLGYVNAVLEDLESVDYKAAGLTDAEMESILSEVRVMRAYHYMRIMDMWGNVPIVTTVGTPVNPQNNTRAEVFAFVKEELEANVEKLQPLSQALVGRVSKAAGYSMLSELYLNAEVWAGTAMYDESIKYSDKVINGDGGSLTGSMSLDPNILGPFSNQNQLSPENIFQFAFSRKGGFTFGWGGFFSGYGNMSRALDVTYSGWNAFVVTPNAFDAYAENDLRKKNWFLFGPQYDIKTGKPILGTEEYDGEPLVYVNNIRRNSEGATGIGSMTEGEENSGARFHKYRSGISDDPNYQENDYVIYRLTEIYFNKAEAIMRKNGGNANAEAVELINASKKRSFSDSDWANASYSAGTLTMDELLAERGREFIFEGKRRTDLIRFGKFTTATWWDHTASDPNKALFPIPHVQISLNPNLTQNPGY
ncbi:putative outer membrane starch-binding protein [Algoriphagus ratkowskyi]|uniref:Putative outer membrane starch-binding protein n=1 Tax=Algoriphagus ratkowskyi TaxID=57028 RepID=A0A2W7SX87_9BACT|nr:RagB/SusD family nutrient uptake outer membrane protein [Algoriphagus ratkowskyi]PZX55442.1 putative outer membrane starch-binding protein [Algoriphagus ratkowskyi]TXD79639.1 RagB/SusD family nutrient uptake outer membrane protein [Algoriphagus ratkowskyi]